ncbi:ribosome biogenesis GTPase YlqF [Gammaproteobacteria bacterium 42_54_T18]|nr:ribosome biogenesis GTPase YlqF [Gammaproteobacteria bacterium 42_54_T18]
MSIQWYPGHMNKARKQIIELLPQVDLVIEVTDARIPYSSENPLLASIRGDKPCIKVLTKSDLADPAITTQWVNYFDDKKGLKGIALTTDQPTQMRELLDLCRSMLPAKDSGIQSIKALIMGIPNVGKSTLINILANKIIAKTGNEPAVTKGQQRIKLDNGIVLFDTPGMLWPKVENPNSGYRLAASGAIKNTAMEYDDVAFYTAKYLLSAYPERLKERYELDTLPDTELEFLETIGKQRGCLRGGGQVDLNKVSVLFLNELRSGILGPISLETPALMEIEEIEVQKVKDAKIRKEEERKKRSQKGKRSSK